MDPHTRYHYNTVLGILEHEFGIKPLFRKSSGLPTIRTDLLKSI
jgi:hypothetical protein